MKTYDPKRILAIFAGIPVQGYAEGTFVNIERSEDGFSLSVGASGDVTRIRSNDKSGAIVLTLQASSPTNDLLSAIHRQDELFGTGTGAFFLKDLNGTTIAEASDAWIVKYAAMEYGDDGPNREWTLHTAELDLNVGGNLI